MKYGTRLSTISFGSGECLCLVARVVALFYGNLWRRYDCDSQGELKHNQKKAWKTQQVCLVLVLCSSIFHKFRTLSGTGQGRPAFLSRLELVKSPYVRLLPLKALRGLNIGLPVSDDTD